MADALALVGALVLVLISGALIGRRASRYLTYTGQNPPSINELSVRRAVKRRGLR